MKLPVHLIPNSKTNKIAGFFGDRLKIHIVAKAQDGKANTELIRFLSKKLGIPKSQIHIVHGLKSRDKTIQIEGLDTEIEDPKMWLSKLAQK